MTLATPGDPVSSKTLVTSRKIPRQSAKDNEAPVRGIRNLGIKIRADSWSSWSKASWEELVVMLGVARGFE